MSVSIDLAGHNRPAPEKAPERQSLLGLSRESLAERLRGMACQPRQRLLGRQPKQGASHVHDQQRRGQR